MPLQWELKSLEGAAEPEEGKPQVFTFHCYQYSDGQFFWMVQPCLEQYHSGRRKVNYPNEAAKERAVLEEVCGRWSLSIQQLYQASRKQIKLNPGQVAGPYSRSSQTVGTKLLIIMLLTWITGAWRNSSKKKAEAMMSVLLARAPQRVVPASSVSSLWEQAKGFCEPEASNESACSHLDLERLRPAFNEASSSHDGLVKLMKELFIRSMLCKAALHICAALVDACATMVNDSVERAPALDAHRAHIRKASNGRLLADDTYRVHAMRTLLSSRKAKNGKGMMRLDGYSACTHHRWLSQEAAAYQATCCKNLSASAGTFGLWEDAARIGNPAKEMLLMMIHIVGVGGCVLPPQAPAFS
jgi:hypothetical protein